MTFSAPSVIWLDPDGFSRPLPHFWEHMFGSCHAPTTVTEDWRNDLRALKSIVDVRYVRFHGIFGREVGLFDGFVGNGSIKFNFTRVDLIYDGLLDLGVSPFIELSFMPEEFSERVSQHPFWYRPNVAPPKDFAVWAQFVEGFVQHLVDRYGLDLVENWYFEVWNEPNIDFWTGEPKQKTYLALYDVTAAAVKAVSPRLRVGGPATAQAVWITPFLKHCKEARAPVDFVSTHIYPNDPAEGVFGRAESIPLSEMVGLAVRKVHAEVQASSFPDLPIIWSEYNAGSSGVQLDTAYVGPWLANTIRQCAGGLVSEMSYWTFTDAFFEEAGVFRSVFSAGYGLIATGSIPKASFNAFRILHYLGDEQIELDCESALLTRRSTDGALVLAVWNYSAPGEPANERLFEIHLDQLAGSPIKALIHLVDDEHGSPYTAWLAMGSPPSPTRDERVRLRRVADLADSVVAEIGTDARYRLNLRSNALAVIELMRRVPV